MTDDDLLSKSLMDEFEKEYRRLVKLWHPDGKPPEECERRTRKMQWLNNLRQETKEAYDLLSK